jgi:hypothetical protein
VSRSVEIACGNNLSFVANAMHGDNATTFHIEPDDPSIEFANVTQFEKAVAQRLRERFAMVLAIAQLGQSSHGRGEIIRIASFEFIEKIAHRTSSIVCFVKLYGELDPGATSILMYKIKWQE